MRDGAREITPGGGKERQPPPSMYASRDSRSEKPTTHIHKAKKSKVNLPCCKYLVCPYPVLSHPILCYSPPPPAQPFSHSSRTPAITPEPAAMYVCVCICVCIPPPTTLMPPYPHPLPPYPLSLIPYLLALNLKSSRHLQLPQPHKPIPLSAPGPGM